MSPPAKPSSRPLASTSAAPAHARPKARRPRGVSPASTSATSATAGTATGPSPTPETPECILVLQGGGALGAYQAGVFEALGEQYREPNWVAGISIGAINAALIAGNPPGRRVARLREFWELLSSALPAPPLGRPLDPGFGVRQALNGASALQVMLCGVPGFFRPRWLPAPLQPPGSLAAISHYDTSPLQATLERLVDFDRLNAGPMRLSVGAVNVKSGNFAYFDTAHQRIDARHIMASAALPPGFAPVEIDGEFYWDGGIVSNTPLQYVLDQPGTQRRVVFQVDLFAARGDVPADLGEVTEREKDIRFSSRTRQNTTNETDRQVIAQAAKRLLAKLPPSLRDDPDALLLAGMRCESAVDVVHLIYRSKQYESQAKDYEFSRLSMHEHWAAGQVDTAHTLHDPRWTGRAALPTGVRVFDLAGANSERTAPVPPKTAPSR